MLTKLGETRLGIITKGIESDRDNKSLALQCCRVIAKSKIKSESGTLAGIKVESLIPKVNASGKPVSLVGRRGDAHTSETLTATRTYDVERYAERRDYDSGQVGDELFNDVKAEMAPAIQRQILFDVDLKFLEIYSGTGVVANSRDVSTYTLAAGQEFDEYAATSQPLHHIEEALALCGGDFIFMSVDVAKALRRHPELQAALTANSRSVLTYRQLAEVLMEQTGASAVVIGRRMYHDGGEYQTLKIDYKFKEVFGVGVKSNVLFLDYGPLKMKEYDEESKSITFLQGDHHSDIVVADPALTIAFANVLK